MKKKRILKGFLIVLLVFSLYFSFGITSCNAVGDKKSEVDTKDTEEIAILSKEALALLIKDAVTAGVKEATKEKESEEDTVKEEGKEVKTEEISFYELEGGIPYESKTEDRCDGEWYADVSPEELIAFTSGPVAMEEVFKLEGGADPDIGNVTILVPDSETKDTVYKLIELCAGSNWYGAWLLNRIPTENDWMKLLDDRVVAMMKAPNGTSGKGCDIVNVIVIQGEEILYEETFEKE